MKLPGTPRILGLLGLARFGAHTGSSVVELRRIRHAELRVDDEPPCQVDGEELCGREFTVDVVPAALKVIFP